VELVELGMLTLRYTTIESVDYGVGGQIYGTMDGRIDGERLAGELRLTNLAARRPDNVNLPTLRGVLTTDDGASVWVELDGIATLRESDGARVFTTTCRFRTGDQRYTWLNTTFGMLEGVLSPPQGHAQSADLRGQYLGGTARGRIHECRPTV
jgi:hypothetical protein